MLGRKDSNGEASTSSRGAEDCSPSDSGGPSLTESKVSATPLHHNVVPELFSLCILLEVR